MLKKIIILSSLIFLFSSCEKIEEKILEEKNISENFSEEKEKKLEKKKIIWDENIKFTKCDDYSNYDRNNDESRKLFYNSNEVSVLTEKLNEDFEWRTYTWPSVLGYCGNDDGKYVFWYVSVSSIGLGIYDEGLNLIELTDYVGKFDQNINYPGKIRDRNYGDRSLEKFYLEYVDSKKKINGFGKKNGNNIPFSVYGQWMTGQAESAPGFFQMGKDEFLKESSIKYCNKGLTQNGKLTMCFVNTFYNFDFIKNEIVEEKICTYYVDDNGEIKTLENCKEL